MSRCIGLRFRPRRFAYVVLDVTDSTVELVELDERRTPPDAAGAASLRWLRFEVSGLLDEHRPDAAAFKRAEVMRVAASNRRIAETERSEAEGVAREAAISHEHSIELHPLLNQNIKAMTKFSGSAKEFDKLLKPLPNVIQQEKYREAALVALAIGSKVT